MSLNIIPRTLARSSFRYRKYLPFGRNAAAQEYSLQRLLGWGGGREGWRGRKKGVQGRRRREREK
jgi:hypothetical protein